MKNTIVTIALIIIAFAVGIFFSNNFSLFGEAKHVEEQQTSVLLERVKTVSKLVTIEGYFSVVHPYKDYYYYDLPFLRKKAILLVNAKVMVGYDLEQMTFETDAENKILYIGNRPDPEIISLDPKIQYYDMSEGTFNNFSTKELTKLNEDARKKIEEEVAKSNLKQIAKEKGNDVIKLVEIICRDAGWTVQYRDGSVPLGSEDSTAIKG